MIRALLSNDMPRSRLLAWTLVLIAALLLLGPFVSPGIKALSVAAKVIIFVGLVASYDLLLGYAGIVSFAHTMFFGIGAYGVAMASNSWGAGWLPLLAGFAISISISIMLAVGIGLFSLRVRAMFFAMITLAVASAFQSLVSQLSDWTGGEDGLTFKVPMLLSPGFELSGKPFLGASIDGRFLSYYLLLVVTALQILALLRIVNSPFGRVLQAIRENEFRAEAIGYRVVLYRTLASVIAAVSACISGALLALWLSYNGPDTSLSIGIMIDVLLIVVIGGMGTIYGSVVGAALFIAAQNYLQDLLGLISAALHDLPWLAPLFSPDRWLLWLGLLFVLSVYYFPAGIVGRMRGQNRAIH